MDIAPNSKGDCGLIFRVTDSGQQTYWESGVSYYLLLVNAEGWILLGKINNGAWSCPRNSSAFLSTYNVKNVYNLKVVLQDNTIDCYVNGQKVIGYRDWDHGSTGLTGTGIGVRSAFSDTVFTNLTVTPL